MASTLELTGFTKDTCTRHSSRKLAAVATVATLVLAPLTDALVAPQTPFTRPHYEHHRHQHSAIGCAPPKSAACSPSARRHSRGWCAAAPCAHATRQGHRSDGVRLHAGSSAATGENIGGTGDARNVGGCPGEDLQEEVSDRVAWRRHGSIPGVVASAGILVARHRRERRQERERQAAREAAEEAARLEAELQARRSRRLFRFRRTKRRTTTAVRAHEAQELYASGGRIPPAQEMIGDSDRAVVGVSMRVEAGMGAAEVAQQAQRQQHQAAEEEGYKEDEGDWYEWEEGEAGEEVKGGDEWEGEEWEAEEDQVTEKEGSRGADTTSAYRQQQQKELATLKVDLDSSVLPPPVHPVLVGSGFAFCGLATVAILARLPRALGVLGSVVESTVDPVIHDSLPRVVGDLRYHARLVGGSLQAWGERQSAALERLFGPEPQMLPPDDWSVCTLQERTAISHSTLRYRFSLQGDGNAVLPLELGQELTLCGLDSYDMVVRGHFVPLTSRRQRGYFDVVVQREPPLDDGAGTREAVQFSYFLDHLAIGDEVAVKPGREGLVYSGPYSPITDLVLFATGLSIVPMIQMINELLPARDSSVSTASVIWLNERAEDFVLYGEVEKAFYRNHRKLDVSCIIERDLYGHQLTTNARVRDASPLFKTGTLAIVTGPDYFTRKVTDFLLRQGYPEDAIVRL